MTMEKIRWPEKLENSTDLLIFLKEAYRKIRAFCNFEERIWLITGNDGNLENYAEKLKRLAEKYNLLE